MVAGCVKQWSSYTVTLVWEFACVDSALAVLDEWLSYRGGHLNIFDCNENSVTLSVHTKSTKVRQTSVCADVHT